MKNNNSLHFNIIINTFYQILVILIPFVTTPYLARVLTSSGVGIYSYCNSLVSYFSMTAAFGTLTYGKYIIARKKDSKKDYSMQFFEIELLTIITSVICLIIWLAIAMNYLEYKIYLIIFSLNIISVIFDISWLYAGLEKFVYTISVNAIIRLVSIACIFVFVKDESDLINYIIIHCFSVLLGNASMWIFLPKFICRVKINLSSLKKHFKGTIVYFIPTIATSIYSILDKTLLGIIVNDNSISGCYEQASKILKLLEVVTFSSFTSVLVSRSTYYLKNNKLNENNSLFNKAIHFIGLLTVGACFGLIGVGDVFVDLFLGPGYEETVYLLNLFSLLLIIMSLSNLIDRMYYIPNGLRKKSNIYLIVGSLTNLLLNVLLIPFISFIGAAISSLVAEIIITFLYIINSKNFCSFSYLFITYYKKIISGFSMLLVVLGLKNLLVSLAANNFYILIICSIVGFFTYLLLLLLLKDKSLDYFFSFAKRRKHTCG